MSENRAREYAEWYVWCKRNLTSTPEICHAAAQAAAEAKRAGGDPQAAARNAAQLRSGPGWSQPETPEVRQFAEWYDWSRIQLGVSGDDLFRATAAAVASLRDGGDAATATSAARAAIGKDDAAQPMPAGSAPPPPPAQTGYQPPLPPPPGARPSEPPPPPPPAQTRYQPPPPPPPGARPSEPPPPPPSGYPPVAPPTWSPGAYPAGPASGYGYPGAVGTDGYAIASLVCSIIALPAILCYGIPAIVLGLVGFFLGRSALKRIRASGGFKGGHGIATAGWIVGIIAAVIGLLVGIAWIGFIALIATGVIPTPSPSP